MRELLIVGVGGFVGASFRHFVYSSNFLAREDLLSRSATGSFCVNLLGCLAIGLAFGYFSYNHAAATTNHLVTRSSGDLQLLLMTGLLGGFTTYSTFALDAFLFLKEEKYLAFVSYLSAQVILGICLVAIGWKLSTFLRQ